MDYAIIKEFLQPGLAILVVLLICVGKFLKTLPKISDWIIPIALWGLGIVITILWFGAIDGYGFTLPVFVNGFVQGTFVAALAVFGNQVYKQVFIKKVVSND